MHNSNISWILFWLLAAVFVCSSCCVESARDPVPGSTGPMGCRSAHGTAEPKTETSTAELSSPPASAQPAVNRFNLALGDRVRLADVLPSGVGAADALFCSSDESVVTLDDQGFLTGTGLGQASITGEETARPVSVLVTVTEPPEPPGIQMEADYCQLRPGETVRVGCRATGAAADAIWASSDEAVATVDEDGTLTGIADGTAWVSVTAGGFTDRVAVWVTEDVPFPPLGQLQTPRFTEQNGVLQNPSSSETGQAVLFLTGDLMALSSQQRAAWNGETYDYNSSFGLVRPIFDQGDFVMGNLETCLSYSNPYTAQIKTIQGNPNCNAQATFLDALRCAGYDALATANNHCGDTGAMGVYETLQLLDSYQIAHTGTFSRSREPRFLLADVNGVRIAFLSYTDLINTKSGELAVPEEDQLLIFNRYSEERATADVAAAKEAGAEYIVAYTHWGNENTHAVTDVQREHAQQLADAGVDFIAGSHSHCLQPPCIITATDGRSVPCIFSMGNFVSGMARDINYDTVILQLDLRREDATIVLDQASYIPCRVFPAYNGGHHVIVPVPGGDSPSPALQAADRRIAEIMGSEVFARRTAAELPGSSPGNACGPQPPS